MMIWLIYGDAIASPPRSRSGIGSIARWKDAPQGDAPVQHLIRLPVFVSQIAADIGRDGADIDVGRRAVAGAIIGVAAAGFAERAIVGRLAVHTGRGRPAEGMGMDRHRGRLDRDLLDARLFADEVSIAAGVGAESQWHAAHQVGKLKSARAVAAVIGADQREQSRVLGDRKRLPLAKRPTDRRKVTSPRTNFGKKRRGHIALPPDRVFKL